MIIKGEELMISISNVSHAPIQKQSSDNNNSQSNQLESKNSPDSQVKEDQKGLTIKIVPGQNNVSSGDRSENTANITVSTSKNQLEFEVSREQAANTLERRLLKKSIEQLNPLPQSGNTSITKAAILAAASSDDSTRKDVVNVAESRLKMRSAQTAFNSISNAQSSNIGLSHDKSNPATSPDSTAQDIYTYASRRAVKLSLATSPTVSNMLENKTSQGSIERALAEYQTVEKN
jgi:hypothetical protein